MAKYFSKEIVHALLLIITIALTFMFPKTYLAQYDFQIAALLFIVFFLAKRILVRKQEATKLLESVIFTLIVLVVVNSSGESSSPFFFLVYFLLFSLSLLLEPVISITSTCALVIFYLMSLPPNQDFKTLLPIFSLAFLTPFAMFMGQQYMTSEQLKTKNEKLQGDSFLFLSLLIKNHITNIKQAADNFMGDHELDTIRKSVRRMEKLIEKYEKTTN